MKRLADLKSKSPLRMVGLMSGTSMDGLDICVAEIDFRSPSVSFQILASTLIPFPSDLRLAINRSLSGPTEQVCATHYDLGRFYSRQTKRFLSRVGIEDIDGIGLHGQTVHHVSAQATLQIGEPSFLAEALAVPVVSDFRARDISVGGMGAPLIPIVDKWLFQRDDQAIICLNLGGIANVTFLPSRSSDETILGFDTGPGMALLDETMARFSGEKYDPSGKRALRGQPDVDVVTRWLLDDFVQGKPPKSTGRDYFGVSWLESNVTNLNQWNLHDLLATLSLFTARSVALNCQQFTKLGVVGQVIVAGGGVRNAAVVQGLKEEFSPIQVVTTEHYGIDPDTKEALGFAILGAAYFKGIPGNVPSVTGASRPVVLGKLTL